MTAMTKRVNCPGNNFGIGVLVATIELHSNLVIRYTGFGRTLLKVPHWKIPEIRGIKKPPAFSASGSIYILP